MSDATAAQTDVQREAWPHIQADRDLVMAAPTGSGKTLAGFLAILNDLVMASENDSLDSRLHLLYVSPLKALVNDIHINLNQPLMEIQEGFRQAGLRVPNINVELRTGDTPAKDRARMLNHPPHILVTTPESLYLLASSRKGREFLKDTRSLIIDEIHALASSKRGAHLALTVARVQRLTSRPFQRIAISATQRPIERVAALLGARPDCAFVDCGHYRDMRLAIEVPDSPLTPVMALEVWEEVYERLAVLVREHTSTLVFVNTRRLAERVAHNLQSRLGNNAVASHHGSLSTARRLDAEQRLKSGSLKALIATASMELGIDVGEIDLVIQIGSPRRVSTLLQRVGRSGHHYRGCPKGVLMPLSLDDLIECSAAISCAHAGDLEEIVIPPGPLDVLAQQIIAEVANAEIHESDLLAWVHHAYPYRNLSQEQLTDVLRMLSDGFATSRGRRAAWLHHDRKDGLIRARKGARMTALTSGGAIPDNADYRVILEPQGLLIGTLNEDFAIESMPGDIFALGTSSWRILRITSGAVRVEDAHGQPPNIPFWFGEAPARSRILSQRVSHLFDQIEGDPDLVVQRLTATPGLPKAAAEQISAYLFSAKESLGELPSATRVVIERFFDTSGGMQLVIHAPFGAAINRAWGLALRKRFCRSFNFELQAAAVEDAIVISLSQVHAFPLSDVVNFLHPDSAREVLVQALLDAPMFQTRWRWNASIALAIPRRSGGKEVPPFIRRMQAEDLIAAVFPDQLACLENIQGDREIPDHPLVTQTIDDCLNHYMDVEGLIDVLQRIRSGAIHVHTVDLPSPSVLANEVLNAKPYAFLDDAPLEERRTRAVQTNSHQQPQPHRRVIDTSALEQLRNQLWPTLDSLDDAYDGLYLAGIINQREFQRSSSETREYLEELRRNQRVVQLEATSGAVWVTWERAPAWQSLHQHPGDLELLAEFALSVLQTRGPQSVEDIAQLLNLPAQSVERGLSLLESRGQIFQGRFDPSIEGISWCERLVLDRLHRLTLNLRRQQVSPIESADFMHFLLHWQHLAGPARMTGADALTPVLTQLEGYPISAAAWEQDILPARILNYQSSWLDALGSSGRIAWVGLSQGDEQLTPKRLVSNIPISLVPRSELHHWTLIAEDLSHPPGEVGQVFEELAKGDLFFDELVSRTQLPETRVEKALSEGVASGRIRCDQFAGLRGLLKSEGEKRKLRRHRRMSWYPTGASAGGRWTLVRGDQSRDDDEHYLYIAEVLLRRYGIVFRKLLDREPCTPRWRDLLRAFWHLEAIGKIRSGRFVNGFSGRQFALPEAIGRAKSLARQEQGEDVQVSACDMANLTGIIPGADRVPAKIANRVLYRNGIAWAAWLQNDVVPLAREAEAEMHSLKPIFNAASSARSR